jgi:putative transposase
VRDEVVDFVNHWSAKSSLGLSFFFKALDLSQSVFFTWRQRYGKENFHNGKIPRDHWLTDAEKASIIAFHHQFPLEGYRRLTYMMIDQNVVAASPASVHRVLSAAGLLRRWNRSAPTGKGKGFDQPEAPHKHWHVDVSYLNIKGTFYCICSILDGFSRALLHFEIREQMKERDVETILQRCREQYPNATPRIITDNGPQFVAKEFKEFVRVAGMTHVRTSPYYPQSNGKIERYHRTLKQDCIREKVPLTLDDARRVVQQFVDQYNCQRLHSAVGYIAPIDMLNGRQSQIHLERDRKLAEARELRAKTRQRLREDVAA